MTQVGEAFRPLTSRAFVMSTYGASMAYVCADSYDKALKAKAVNGVPALYPSDSIPPGLQRPRSCRHQNGRCSGRLFHLADNGKPLHSYHRVHMCCCFQASVVIPGWIIHKVVDLTKMATASAWPIVCSRLFNWPERERESCVKWRVGVHVLWLVRFTWAFEDCSNGDWSRYDSSYHPSYRYWSRLRA